MNTKVPCVTSADVQTGRESVYQLITATLQAQLEAYSAQLVTEMYLGTSETIPTHLSVQRNICDSLRLCRC